MLTTTSTAAAWLDANVPGTTHLAILAPAPGRSEK